VWDQAERMLEQAAKRAQLVPLLAPKAGAFYGPKLEFSLPDRLGRRWQCGTIQLDLVLPERFDVSFMDAAGVRQRPLMLHRATLGSLERFLGVVLEQHGGHLPAWLAPDQVVVVPIEAELAPYAEQVVAALRETGLRVVCDARNESLARRIALAHEDGIPFVAVIGRRERDARLLSLRARDEQWLAPLDEAVIELARRCAAPL
jgi:threonyl-tRNA synthetase